MCLHQLAGSYLVSLLTPVTAISARRHLPSRWSQWFGHTEDENCGLRSSKLLSCWSISVEQFAAGTQNTPQKLTVRLNAVIMHQRSRYNIIITHCYKTCVKNKHWHWTALSWTGQYLVTTFKVVITTFGFNYTRSMLRTFDFSYTLLGKL